jgi:hypothetical protein
MSDRPRIVPRGTPLRPGRLYLHLFHGRTDPAEELADWGFAGPTFGPLRSVHQTDAATWRLFGADNTEVWLSMSGELIAWDGAYFGDASIFIATDGDTP